MGYDKQALIEYYKSKEWAAKRSERLKIDGYKCAKCGFTRALEVHHINYERVFHEDVSRDLITLCKRCHNEIESQKKAVNPLPAPAEHHSVYLAGKISRDDWRNVFCNYRGIPCEPEVIAAGYECDVSDALTITGPFFISCDHGCYHGDNTHGVGAGHGSPNCIGDYYTREDVLFICKRQSERADIVFAYIDQLDCFGTLTEIGYAHAKGKDIVIVFSNAVLKRDMWFADKMQQRTGTISDKWINEQLITKIGGTQHA